ncbi:MAG: DUF6644 family protein [Bryobacteraceae bacterium]
MMDFAYWLQSTGFFTALRQSWYVYPFILSLHMIGIALFGGLIVATDLRLLGVALTKHPAAEVVNSLRPIKHAGLTLMVLCGLLMFGSKAEEYLLNPWFHAKLTLLVLVGIHALVFRKSVYAKAAEFDAAGTLPGNAKLAATLSLILWTGLLICGRGIGYINPDLDRVHALLLR